MKSYFTENWDIIDSKGNGSTPLPLVFLGFTTVEVGRAAGELPTWSIALLILSILANFSSESITTFCFFFALSSDWASLYSSLSTLYLSVAILELLLLYALPNLYRTLAVSFVIYKVSRRRLTELWKCCGFWGVCSKLGTLLSWIGCGGVMGRTNMNGERRGIEGLKG